MEIPLLIKIMFVVAIVLCWYREFALFILGTNARGEIIGYAERVRRAEATSFAPIVEFSTANGQRIVFESELTYGWRYKSQDAQVQVKYLRKSPQKAAVANFGFHLGLPLTLLVIAGFLFQI